MKIGQKNYLIKVFDLDYNLEAGIADARINFYKDRINSGLGEFVFDVERTIDDWTTLGNLQLAKIIELWVNDNDTNEFIRVYTGYVSRINFVESPNKKSVTVTCLGFVSRLGGDVYKNGTTTTITDATTEPATIFKNIIDRLRDVADGNIPFLSYTPESVQDTGISATIKFESDNYLEALEKVLDVCPANWFWKLDHNNIFNLGERPVEADHNFSMGNMESLQVNYSIENIVNGVLTWDNDVVYRYIANTPSQSLYGRRIKKVTVNSGAGTDTMDKQAQSLIGEDKDPRTSILITLADNNEFEAFGDLVGYDIESVKPGQTCRINGIDEVGGFFLGKNMLIRSVTYYPTSAILEVENDIEGIDDLLVNAKRETDQIEKDGIPTSYTAV